MRLLHTQKEGLEFEEFQGEDIPPYAILSHTWYSDNQEVSYQDVLSGRGKERLGYEKIIKCKALALEFRYKYFWVDTCCIDKASSAELSEAINSMYIWYEKSAVCFAYLSDVSGVDRPGVEEFRSSRWFTRGWTLQELLAPATVIFFTKDWGRLNEKKEFAYVISSITGIPVDILSSRPVLSLYSVAERMSWAANRVTTRIEDEAYCLMGLFGVNMPLLYGEKEKAFRRLQEEIMKISDDQSLFAWSDSEFGRHQLSGLLARRPKAFEKSKGIYSMGAWGKGNVVGMTNRGVQAKFYLKPLGENDARNFVASLDCWRDVEREYTVIIFLRSLGTIASVDHSAHETHFARMHSVEFLGYGARIFRVGGEYRDICVRDMAHSALDQLSLGAYGGLRRHIRIQDPSRPFAVIPTPYWEPQTGIYTAQHDYSGALGAVTVPSDECTYVAFFGRDTKGEFFVRADVRALGMPPVDEDDVLTFQQLADEHDMESGVSWELTNGPTGGRETFAVRVVQTALYNVLIYEMSMVIYRGNRNAVDFKIEKDQIMGMVEKAELDSYEQNVGPSVS